MPEITARERYHAVMRFQPGVRTLMWEFGYWNGAVERWYGEGLQRTPYSPPPGLPFGGALVEEAVSSYPPLPDAGYYWDSDVHNQLGFDDGVVRIPLNWRLSPPYDVSALEEDETTQLIIDAGGLRFITPGNIHRTG